MYGARFPQVIKELFERADLNMLEQGLLDKYLMTDYEKMPELVANLAKKVLAAKGSDLTRRAKKDLEKVVALFEKHDFWSN